MKFKSMYSDKLIVYNDPGSPVKDEFQLRNIDGIDELVKIGESDWYGYIQSHADSVDIHKILERCAMIQDYSLLNKMPAQFMDATNMPKNLAEAHTMIQDAHNYFDMMPTDIKEQYNNNYMEFLNAVGTGKFADTVGKFLDSIKKKEEMKVDES